MKKLAFIIPWYAANITGGAESELRGIVGHLTKAGVDLEVLTTCVKQFIQVLKKKITEHSLVKLT